MQEEYYIDLISSQLDGFVQKSPNLYNSRCPICGDSERKRAKKRFYIFLKDGHYNVFCHNCNYSAQFKTFLKRINPELYKDMMFDLYGSEKKKSFLPDTPKKEKQPDWKNKLLLPRISELDKTHEAYKYVTERLLPVKHIYYAENFMKFTNKLLPGTFTPKTLKYDHPRIVVPFYNEEKILQTIQGRTINDHTPKYYNIKLFDDASKVWGVDRIKPGTIYVFEGVFDAMFVDNSVAVLDAHYIKILKYYDVKRLVIVPDSDIRNSEILRSIKKCIEAGLSVALLPRNQSCKDINQMVIDGMSKFEIKRLIDSHTFSGLQLRLEFNKWKKIRNI